MFHKEWLSGDVGSKRSGQPVKPLLLVSCRNPGAQDGSQCSAPPFQRFFDLLAVDLCNFFFLLILW